MKLAIVGSRDLNVKNIDDYIPENVSEIVSGGARGIDSLAAKHAQEHGIKLTEILPDYKRFGRAAPIKRNELIADYADEGIAFWDGKSRGTQSTIKFFEKRNKPIKIIII